MTMSPLISTDTNICTYTKTYMIYFLEIKPTFNVIPHCLKFTNKRCAWKISKQLQVMEIEPVLFFYFPLLLLQIWIQQSVFLASITFWQLKLHSRKEGKKCKEMEWGTIDGSHSPRTRTNTIRGIINWTLPRPQRESTWGYGLNWR